MTNILGIPTIVLVVSILSLLVVLLRKGKHSSSSLLAERIGAIEKTLERIVMDGGW